MEQEELKVYTLDEAAKEAGIAVSTLRYWYIAIQLVPKEVKDKLPYKLPKKSKSEDDMRRIEITSEGVEQLKRFSNWFHKGGGRGLFRIYNRRRNYKNYKSYIERGYKYESK